MIKIQSILSAIMLLCCAVLSAEPFSLAPGRRNARIVVESSLPSFVELAARDLSGDVAKISGKALPVVRAKAPRRGDVFISASGDGRWEAYEGTVRNGVLRLTGSDARGAMFAIYDFTEHWLGIDPLYYWNQAAIPQKDRLEWDDISFSQDSPDFRFRGWFINDEDLLTAWLPSGGDRFVIYPYYSTIVNPAAIEKVAEALVRCRFNLIIPASLLNVLNPAEKRLADICAARGVYLSMHHVAPLGVSAFDYVKYWKDRGEPDKPFSYWGDPASVEEVWRETARVWAEYPAIIWQIGLRGLGDRPVWLADKGIPDTDASRGAVISKAMRRQVEILDEVGVPRKGRMVSTTLWAEGSQLNALGLLDIPEGTEVVFADNSPGWIWQDDFYSTPRKPGSRYGVYYHPALIDSGPHVASLVPASKMYSMLDEARRSGAGDYAMINVGNVREFTYNLAALEDMLWDMDSYNPEDWTRKWVERHYSSSAEEWNNIYNYYYNALQLNPATGVPAFMDGLLCNRADTVITQMEKMIALGVAEMEKEPFNPSYSGRGDSDMFWKSLSVSQVSRFPSYKTEYSAVCAQRAYYEMASEAAAAFYARLPEQEKPFALTTIVYPSEIMYHLTDWYAWLLRSRECLSIGEKAMSAAYWDKSIQALEDAIALEKVYCTGYFEGWWNDCRKINMKGYRERMKKVTIQ